MLIFKVDSEKAFDSVSWKYLDFVLHSLNFGSKWRSWIRACLHSSKASILINGNPTCEFSIKRGLRQGDPLSSFLFILVMEGLQCAMSNAVVHIFYLASGLRINIHKSNIYGIRVSNDEISSLVSRTGCATGFFPFSYLGLLIGANMNLTSSWSVLIDRFQKRLSSWKANLLSIRGRLTFIKAVLGSLGIYYLLIFKAPKTILNTLKSLCSRFFWGGSQDSKNMAWVKWSQVLPSFDKGGLNIGSLKAFNFALLQKWRWSMFSSPNTLWVNTIKALYGQENEGCNFNGTWSRIVGTSNFLYLKDIIPLNSFLFKVDLSVDEDTCTWSLADDGIFSVRSSRRLIDSKLLPSILSSTSWDNIISLLLLSPGFLIGAECRVIGLNGRKSFVACGHLMGEELGSLTLKEHSLTNPSLPASLAFSIIVYDDVAGHSQYGNHVRSLLRLLLPAAIVEKPKDADTEMEQEKFEAAMILATVSCGCSTDMEWKSLKLRQKKEATQICPLKLKVELQHFKYAVLDSGDVVELTLWDEMARELKPIFLITSSTLSTHLIAPTFAGTPETTTPLQLRGTIRSLKTLTVNRACRVEEAEKIRKSGKDMMLLPLQLTVATVNLLLVLMFDATLQSWVFETKGWQGAVAAMH
ncbi:putative RNA-directed DNA polymerase, eukaryota, reverse transcriptase zinc-binding domain protein [Tanacetum coccineum]